MTIKRLAHALCVLTMLVGTQVVAQQVCTCSPLITSSNSATFIQNQLGSFTITLSGSPAPVLNEIGLLPAGVTLVGTHLSGTPTVAGTFSLTLTATNGELPDATQTFTLTVTHPITPPPGRWIPHQRVEWNWQLDSPPSVSQLLPSSTNPYPVYDIDGFDNPASTVAALHTAGAHAICYIDVGTWENWRSDATQFPTSLLGSSNGWPGERWLDIRQIALLAPIMTNRVRMCVAKGFDAVEPDNIDGYTNSTGFPLTAANQLAYNEWIATMVHSLGLSVALKNDGDQVGTLLPYFDFDINEQCVQYSECSNLTPFITAGKAVFEAEYRTTSGVCAALNALNFNGIEKNVNLTAPVTECR
jgi:hypothetical protein